MPEWKAGDILLWQVTPETKSWLSRLLAWWFPRFGQGGCKECPSYSHAAVLSEKIGWVYESTWPRTRHAKIPVSDYLQYGLTVFRISGITEKQRSTVLAWCRGNLDKWYDVWEILSFGLINLKKYDACSEFARKAFASAGITLGRKCDYLVSANEIAYETKFLTKIGTLGLEKHYA